MKKNVYDYQEVRIHTPEFNEFVITGGIEEVDLAVKSFTSFGKLREASKSTFDRAVYGKPVREPVRGLSFNLGRLSLALN